jgi:hypothetical protein
LIPFNILTLGNILLLSNRRIIFGDNSEIRIVGIVINEFELTSPLFEFIKCKVVMEDGQHTLLKGTSPIIRFEDGKLIMI